MALSLVSPMGSERIPIEKAIGRVLAQSVHAVTDLPPEPRSRLDGFAIRSSDTRGASLEQPKALGLLPGCLAAGYASTVTLEADQAVQILTGAPIPINADAVAPFEEAAEEGNRVFLRRAIHAREGLSTPGEEIKKGEVVLARGQILTPTRLAMLAALGHGLVEVFVRPRVALLSSGDEVKELGDPLEGPWTYCNNRHLIGWLTTQHGGNPLHLGVAPDDAARIAKALDHVEAELIVTTGGIGRGQRDFILGAWEELGVRPCFRQINLIPGKNSALGIREKQIFWALPGNPWGAQVVFEELIAPALWRFQGLDSVVRPRVRARLERSVKKGKGFFKAVRGILKFHELSPSFVPLVGRKSSLFNDLGGSFAYILPEPHREDLPEGTEVDVFFHDCPLAAYPLLLNPALC